jgi:hypothetical protein
MKEGKGRVLKKVYLRRSQVTASEQVGKLERLLYKVHECTNAYNTQPRLLKPPRFASTLPFSWPQLMRLDNSTITPAHHSQSVPASRQISPLRPFLARHATWLIRRLLFRPLRPFRNLHHGTLTPNVHHSTLRRHHLLGQAHQTPAFHTQCLLPLRPMH